MTPYDLKAVTWGMISVAVSLKSHKCICNASEHLGSQPPQKVQSDSRSQMLRSVFNNKWKPCLGRTGLRHNLRVKNCICKKLI